MPDIDIDFADRSKILNIIRHVPASISLRNTCMSKSLRHVKSPLRVYECLYVN